LLSTLRLHLRELNSISPAEPILAIDPLLQLEPSSTERLLPWRFHLSKSYKLWLDLIMATIRKACRNCTFSKRKCTIQVPQCDRCSKKGLQCVPDLEPLSASAVDMKKDSEAQFNPFNDIKLGYCVVRTLASLPSHDPNIFKHEETFILDMMHFAVQSIHELLWKGKPALFIHPGLHIQGNYNHFAALTENQTGGVSHPCFKRLLEVDVEAVPILEALTAFQALLIHMSVSLFSPDSAEQANAEKFIPILSLWTQALLIQAQPKLPATLSPWQTWLFGESVRRSILMSHAVSLLYASLKQRFCSTCLFFESLPIDRRLGLWLAESPQAWIATAGAKVGKEVGEQLSSMHEFAQDIDMTSLDFSGDIFLTLIAIGHNGRR
jgi:hypothetical protein